MLRKRKLTKLIAIRHQFAAVYKSAAQVSGMKAFDTITIVILDFLQQFRILILEKSAFRFGFIYAKRFLNDTIVMTFEQFRFRSALNFKTKLIFGFFSEII
jgi:hypothetical protein